MDSLITYRNTKKISCLIFLSTATSSILFDGGPKANARADAAHRRGIGRTEAAPRGRTIGEAILGPVYRIYLIHPTVQIKCPY
jgi:hypothetical protein